MNEVDTTAFYKEDCNIWWWNSVAVYGEEVIVVPIHPTMVLHPAVIVFFTLDLMDFQTIRVQLVKTMDHDAWYLNWVRRPIPLFFLVSWPFSYYPSGSRLQRFGNLFLFKQNLENWLHPWRQYQKLTRTLFAGVRENVCISWRAHARALKHTEWQRPLQPKPQI